MYQVEKERFLIPIAYASKERYVMRLEDDPNLDKKVQMALPRLSFEMTGLSYDSSRKQNTNTKNFASSGSGTISQYNPVPYNFDFSLYLYVRNIEDATQVIEHIVPYFTPDYTVKINMIIPILNVNILFGHILPSKYSVNNQNPVLAYSYSFSRSSSLLLESLFR